MAQWQTLIGRPDLIGVPVDPYGGSSGIPQSGVSASVGAQGVDVQGRLTAGVLVVMLVGVFAFHMWTRNVQN